MIDLNIKIFTKKTIMTLVFKIDGDNINIRMTLIN